MEYIFPHPDDCRVLFRYNDQVPGFIRKTVGHRSEQITLIHKNVNAEDFFFCLIKAKSVYIEDKYQGYAIVEEKEFKIRKPYDCKWAIHQLFGVVEANPLIVSDRREKRYIWPFSDEEMNSGDFFSNSLFGTSEQYFSATPGLIGNSWQIRRIDPLDQAVEPILKAGSPVGHPKSLNSFQDFAEEAESEFEDLRKKTRQDFEQKQTGNKDG